ncbi:MAG: alpha/beta fold hydrolase [bacterium]
MTRRAVIAFLVVGTIGACAGPPSASSDGLLHLCISWTTRELARCGVVSVAEDRSIATGRRIDLHVMVLPARDRRISPAPLVFLDGGPGLSAIHDAAYASGVLADLRATHDLLLVDMRGTGKSNPLRCDLYDDDGRLAPYLAPMFPLVRVRECAKRLSTRADLTQYTTTAAAADLEAVRSALGYPQLNLYGASYGTRLALEYMRRYPERVRRSVLLSPIPPNEVVGSAISRAGDDALTIAIASCRIDDVCNSAAPDPRADIDALLTRLQRQAVTVRLWNWRRLSHDSVALTRRGVAELLWVESYDPDAIVRAFPRVHQAVAGNYLPLVTQLLGASRRRRADRSEGLMLSVFCAEDVPWLHDSSSSLAATRVLGNPIVPELIAACADWPRGRIASDFKLPVRSSVPTLIIAGGRDPVTPSDIAESTATFLSRHELYVDSTKGHGSLDDRAIELMKNFFIKKID